MQRNSGSFMELFTCRNCKKRMRTKASQSKARHKSAPMALRRSESIEIAPTSTSSKTADDDDGQRHRAMRMRSRSDDDNSDVIQVFPNVVGIPRISTSCFEMTSDNSHHSILKNAAGDSPTNDVTKRHSSSGSAGEKRARFKEAVDVIVHDHHGNAIVKDRVRLKPSVECAATTPSERDRVQLFSACDKVSRTVARGQGAFSLQSMRIERMHDGRRFLRLVVVLDEAFTQRSIHVCTANGGSRILVGAYRPEPLGDGTNYLRQYVDRFQLPHPIDSLSIKGELDAYGELIITAPLFDFECESMDDLILNK